MNDAARMTVEHVKQVGMVAFLKGDKDKSAIASEAAYAIIEQDKKILDLSTLMISNVKYDSSWESVTYEMHHRSPGTVGTLVRRIKYKEIAGIDRSDDLTYGPLIPKDKAEALLAILNA